MFTFMMQVMAQSAMPLQQWDSIMVKRLSNIADEIYDGPCATGFCVYDLTADYLVYGCNHEQLMRPASTQKLFTAISTLDLVGADKQFETKATISGEYIPDTLGYNTLRGTISIRGSMDPLVRQSDLQCVIDTLKRHSVTRIEGQILADLAMKRDTTMFGAGWCWDDENPRLDPMLHLSIPNFISALSRNGICFDSQPNIHQGAGIKHSEFIVASHTVKQVLQRMMKNSDNQHAESMFCLLGTLSRGRNTQKDRAAQVRKTLSKTDQQTAANSQQPAIIDGSGLSLYNYCTARQLVAMLKYAYSQQHIFKTLYPSLPIAGRDGTLANRMKTSSASGNVHAKTGSVNHVSSLAGYATAPTGHLLAFAIISNGIPSQSYARRLQDRICEIITTK